MSADEYRSLRFQAMNTEVEAVWRTTALSVHGQPRTEEEEDMGAPGERAYPERVAAMLADRADRDVPIETDILDWFDFVERTFSRFRPDSALSRFNGAGASPFVGSAALLEVLGLADEARRNTDGWFDPFILPMLEHAGYATSFDKIGGMLESVIPVKKTRDPEAVSPACPLLRLDGAIGAVRKEAAARLDLGGIVKGWAVDRLSGWLKSRGVGQGLLNAGGDLIAWGASPASPWLIDLAHPDDPETVLATVPLTDGAAATSSTRRRRWKNGSDMKHHLIDPRTGRPSESDVVQCTVIGSRAADCEVWAKTVCVAGSSEGRRLLAAAKAPLKAYAVTAEGAVMRIGAEE